MVSLASEVNRRRAEREAQSPAFRGLQIATSGEHFANWLGDQAGKIVPAFRGRESGSRILGRGEYTGLEDIPMFGGPLAFLADTAAAPLSIATAGFGAPVAGFLKGMGPVGRAAGSLLTPIAKSGNFAQRLGAETAVAASGKVGSELAQQGVAKVTDNETAQTAAGLIGAVAGGAYGARTLGKFQDFYAMTPAERSGLPLDDPRRRLLDAMGEARALNRDIKGQLREEQGKRTAASFMERSGLTDPLSIRHVINRNIKGEYGLGGDLPALTMDKPDVDAIWERVLNFAPHRTGQHEYELADSITAFNNLLTGERVEPAQLKRLSTALGVSLEAPKTGWKAKLDDVVNVPRSLMSTFDMSAPLIQGITGVRRKEWWGAWTPMLKAFADEKYAKGVNDEIINRPTHLLQLKHGGYIAPMFESVSNGQVREEAFRSSLAEHLPVIGGLIRRSDLAYTTFLNRMRADLWDNSIKRLGPGATKEELDFTAQNINMLTGRGPLPDNFVGSLMGSTLFSARRLTAWGQTVNPKRYMDAPPPVRAEMLKDLGGFVGLGMSMLTLAAVAAKANPELGISVQLDPRSSDFGKIKQGQTRYNPWGGLQPIARYAAQFLTGQRVTSSGKPQDVDQATTAGRFYQSKLAPVPGFLVDWLRGEDFMGGEFDVGSTQGLSEQAKQRLAPLFLQDMAEAMSKEGWQGAIKQAPSVFGASIQTFGDTAQVRNDAAMRDFNVPWERLTATQKADIEQRYAPQLEAVNRDAKEGEYRFEQIRIDESARAAESAAVARYQAGGMDSRQFNAVIQDITRTRAVQLQQTRQVMGFKDDPNDILGQYLNLFDKATDGGVTDYALLDQLQEEFKAGVTDSQDRARLEDYSRFQHVPELDSYFDAKDTLRSSGYWKAEQDAFAKARTAVERVAPGVRTRDQLERLAGEAAASGNRLQALRIESVMKRIDADTKVIRDRMRMKNRAVDEALVSVYGAVPIRERKSGGSTKGALARLRG